MPKLDQKIKEKIGSLSKKDLEKLVIKAASSNQQFYDYLLVNHIDTEFAGGDMYEQALTDIKNLMNKNYKGFADELKLANMLDACNKRIAQFGKNCKDKSRELDLLMYELEVPFSLPSKMFTTCFTNYNYRVFLMLKKAITLLETKLHEDYMIQYAPKLNEYLSVFHKTSSHLDYVYGMQKEIKI